MLSAIASRTTTGIVLLLACIASRAADPVASELQLAVTDPRPVAKALEVLSDRHGIAITYEDPRTEFAGDLVDITSEISRSPPKPGQKIWGLRSRSIDVTYSVSPVTGEPQDVAATIRKILDMHAAGGGSQFELIEEGQNLHVVPVMVRNSQGTLQATSSVLDTRISLPMQSRSGLETVAAICQALSAAAKVRVVLGMLPISAMANDQIVEGAASEPARNILSRSLKDLSATTVKRLDEREERQYVWWLFFDPNQKMYALNLALLLTSNVVTQEPAEPQPDPGALDPDTGRRTN